MSIYLFLMGGAPFLSFFVSLFFDCLFSRAGSGLGLGSGDWRERDGE